MGARADEVDVSSMRLVMPGNARALDPAPALFDAMRAGWTRQQQSRLLARKTIADQMSLVRRFALFNGMYPWEWTAEDVEAYFSAQMSSQSPLAHSTVRGQQSDLRLRAAHRRDPGSRVPARQRTSDASLLRRLEAANARIRRPTEENRQLREQLARALGEQRTATTRTSCVSD
ncbi:hypothetical protein [Streptomyces sp. NPDC020817]|uniref:hypothetical protein n=1 Tax=Streptomyces sp. NPDC020817 TaxID=3365095 RepID=UPI0037956964